MENITREEISEFINNKFGLSKKDCADLVNDLIEDIIAGLIANNFVKIHNFGTFKIKKKNERIGRNPKTKEDVIISARNVISFIPSKKILKVINNKSDEGKKI
jgi:integration host factor subunit alpha